MLVLNIQYPMSLHANPETYYDIVSKLSLLELFYRNVGRKFYGGYGLWSFALSIMSYLNQK